MKYDVDAVKSILCDGGLLSKYFDNYSERQSQIDLANAIYRSYKDGINLIAEAPTGIGKSIAGLVPAILMAVDCGLKTVISTSTKALQSQYFEKDLPFLYDVFIKSGKHFSYAMMKGKSNYLCRRRLEEYVIDTESSFDVSQQYEKISTWAEKTIYGDFEELPFEIFPSLKSEICCSEDDCDGKNCSHDCCYKKVRARAKSSDIVLVNTDLLCLDLIVRDKYGASVIPTYHSVIIDEAHGLEDIFSKYCGFSVSEIVFKRMIGFAMKYANRIKKEYCNTDEKQEDVNKDMKSLEDASLKLMKCVRSFFDNFVFEDVSLNESIVINHSDFDSIVNIAGKKVVKSVSIFVKNLSSFSYYTSDEVMDNMFASVNKRINDVMERFAQLMKLFDEDDNTFVYWVSFTKKGIPIIEGRPIDISDYLERVLFDRKMDGTSWDNIFESLISDGEEKISMPVKNVVMMSATMTTNHSFEFLKTRLGIKTCDEIILPHAFDYKHNALLYVPKGLVEPNISRNSEVFTRQLVSNIIELANITDGKMLCLFTSYAEMQRVYDIVNVNIGNKYRIFNQTQYPKMELIKMFKSDVNSILFATSSFWTGVDVQGEALSALVIDRIPFPVPTDPLIEARINKIKSEGGNWFNNYYIPMASMELCQGFGRLIRTKTDMGIVMICDVRLITKPYGSKFLHSFPLTLTTRKIDKVKLFYDIVRKKRERSSKN